MENSNNENIDEIFEFPENYEEIANQALFNFEKNCKFDLNKLIQKGINIEKTNIKQKKIIQEIKKMNGKILKVMKMRKTK